MLGSEEWQQMNNDRRAGDMGERLKALVGIYIMMLGCAAVLISGPASDNANLKLKAEIRIAVSEISARIFKTKAPEAEADLKRVKRLLLKQRQIRAAARKKDKLFDGAILALVLAMTIAGPVLVITIAAVSWVLISASMGVSAWGVYQATLALGWQSWLAL
jgi:hypothetical protein